MVKWSLPGGMASSSRKPLLLANGAEQIAMHSEVRPLSMKIPLQITALLLAVSPLPAHGTEPVTAPSEAHLLGDPADGTPAPPEPEKPGFVVPPQDILDSQSVPQGGRTITVRKIKPVDLPQRPQPPSPENPVIQQRMAAIEEQIPETSLLFFGATVFRSDGGPARTLVSLQTEGNSGQVTFWSSADFALLSGFSSFAGTNDKTYGLIMAWGSTSINQLEQGPDTPALPTFPAGNATFIIATPNPSPEALAAIQSLHDLYNNEHERLKTAFEGRERARLRQEADLKANPPQPKNLVLSHWRIEAPAVEQQEGGGQ